MSSAEVSSTIVHSSILPVNAGVFSTSEAMACRNKLIRVADKLKSSNDQLAETTKELELRAATAEGKITKLDSKLQAMDSKMVAIEQEISALRMEKKQLSKALTSSNDNLVNAEKAAKNEGCNEATVVYEVQFAKLKNMLFEDGWTSALEAANVPTDFELRKNVPYPRPEAAEQNVVEGVETGSS
ncbi:hypothetical protein CsSME_00022179 [Camellia sinensis var. sinensis]